ncbi:UPF0280 family protein [Minwuia thermotolerans]|uniref:Uncharacterized protein n=1 Tax=Minwuia thermotolerans TaxID=2056226 RepID=A0A2M9G5H1_9PROT|nr:UPF0280 family protein [Minwuia thermotolerans]PJK30963.1 hypothetical protein CVT23_03615 [Minwuia thermotolerans]
MNGPQAAMLPDGRRLHLQHGPIDLVIGADGQTADIRNAYRAARGRFETILPGLVEELNVLRRPLEDHAWPAGPVARRMADAVAPHGSVFVTPMAAVAGSVADEVLAVMRDAAPALRRIHVNNGGDIALWLAAGERYDVGLVADPRDGRQVGTARLTAADGVGGIATSGRHGRSLSLGIADSVTVLAPSAAAADAAATLIANAVDLPGHPAVERAPAREIDPDSDLGERPVVIGVGRLPGDDIDAALAAGRRAADDMVRRGLIHSAALWLRGRSVHTEAVTSALRGWPAKRLTTARHFRDRPGSRFRTPAQGGHDAKWAGAGANERKAR